MARESNRGLVLPYLESFVKKKLSANKVLNILKANGLGYRRQTFLRDYKQARFHVKRMLQWKSVNKNKFPTERLFSSKPFNHGKKYSYITEFNVYDSAGNFIRTDNATIISDRLLRIDTIEAMTEYAVSESGSGRYDNIGNIMVIDGYTNANIPF